MRAAPRGPTALPRPPEGVLAVLARLDTALGAAHAALRAAHPAALRSRHPAALSPPVLATAALVISRSAARRRLLARYQRTRLDEHPPAPDDRDERQATFPF